MRLSARAPSLSRRHGCQSALQETQSSSHPIVGPEPYQRLAGETALLPGCKGETEAEFFFFSKSLVLSLSPTQGSPSSPSRSHGKSRRQRNPRIKSFIVFRAVVIGLGTLRRRRRDFPGPGCRGRWRLWPRGRAQPTFLSPATSARSVGRQTQTSSPEVSHRSCAHSSRASQPSVLPRP